MLSIVRLTLMGCVSLAAFLVATNIAFAARIVTVEILIDGEEVMGIARTDLGEDHATMWQYLKADRFSVERDFEVPALEEDPLKAVLIGKLEMRLVYGNSDIAARAQMDQLTLVRRTADSDEWFLDPADVDRTMALAGLRIPPRVAPPPPSSLGARLVAGLVIFLLIVGVALLVRLRSVRAMR